MKTVWLQQQGRKKLLVFFNGWGMDPRPLSRLACLDYDLLEVHDYTTLTGADTVVAAADKYQETVLVAWSMGVWAAQESFSGLPGLFSRAVAINGTLCPIHDELGIPKRIYLDTLVDFGEEVRKRFYRRMCREKTNLRLFLECQPERDLIGQGAELESLAARVQCLPLAHSIYDQVVVAENDWVMPTANQLRFWGEERTLLIHGFHYVFASWESWDHLLAFVAEGIPATRE